MADIWNPKTLETWIFRSRKLQRLRASEASGHGVPNYKRVRDPRVSGLCEDGCINTGVLVSTFPVGWPPGQSSQAPRHKARLFSLSSLSDAQWILGASDSKTLRFCELWRVGRTPCFLLCEVTSMPLTLCGKMDCKSVQSSPFLSSESGDDHINPTWRETEGWKPSPVLSLSLVSPIHAEGHSTSFSFPRNIQISTHSQSGISACLGCPCDLIEFFSFVLVCFFVVFFFPDSTHFCLKNCGFSWAVLSHWYLSLLWWGEEIF